MRTTEYPLYIRLAEYAGGGTGLRTRKWQGLAQPWGCEISRYRTHAGDMGHEEALHPNDCCDTYRHWPRLSISSMLSRAQWLRSSGAVTHFRRHDRASANI